MNSAPVRKASTRTPDARALFRSAAATTALALLLFLVLRLAVRGVLPAAAVAVLAPLVALALLLAAHRAVLVLAGEPADLGAIVQRPVFVVLATGIVLGLPLLGYGGLVDPWETHYAEVAREMLARRDFVSPWWANEGWFMTKPVLTFWLEAVAMAGLGVGTAPDAVLGAGAHAHPEWAVRLPHLLFALTGSAILTSGVARTCGRRAGLLGGLALVTMPGFALLSHQALTDMPLVASIAAALGLLLHAESTSDAALVTPRAVDLGASGLSFLRGRTASVHAGHGVVLVIALVLLPQIAMLVLTRGRLTAGSPFVCGLPGQPGCVTTAAAHPRLTPLLQASMWILPTTWLLFRAAAEQRVARLLALLAWTFAALGAMAKGPAGLVIPAGAVALHALSRRDPRALLRLEVLPGLVLAATMILPWYLAVWARHGRGFIDELVFRHMLGRTLDHLHDTNEGEDVGIVYFVRQLGYATFPWSGLAVTGVLGAAREDARSRRGSARALLFGATAVAFAVVSIMRTKFHHYGLIVLPGAAMLAGLAADEAIAIARRSRSPRASVVAGSLLTAAAISALVGLDLARGPARFILLLSYRYTRTWSGTAAYASVIAGLGAIAVLAIAVSASPRLRLRALAVAGASALALSAVLLDAYLPACGRDGGQREVFAAYYREHPEATEPLVAYQLNWKGENFYSGNHLAIFVTSGAPMKTYLDRRRERGARTVYFVTERGRVTTLRHELGAVASFAELTGPEVSSEFTLVRATL